jgi:P4 family phage/plasmid primase-like protien
MNNNTFFCASLQEAFASVTMAYPDSGIVPGKMARFSANGKPGDTAGWCKLFPDGEGAVFGCHREGTSFTWQQRNRNAPPPSAVERQAAHAKFAKARQEAERERAAEHAAAAMTAVRILAASLDLDPGHAYINHKGIKPFLARQSNDGAIVLPIYGADGALQTLQYIHPQTQRHKTFLYQGKAKGGRLFIGDPVNGLPLDLTEGWATGCSTHEATGDTVVICFSGANMAEVAADLRRQFPASPLRIAGDRDPHGKGLAYANAAAAVGAGVVILPVFADGRAAGDFNDLHQAEGLGAVRRQLAVVPATSSRELVPFMAPSLPKADARDGTCDTRPLTEYGNAQRLFDAHGDCLRYVHETQSWMIWDGSAWKADGIASVRMLAANMSAAIYDEGAGHLNDAEHFARWARKSQEQRTIAAAVSLLSDFQSVRIPLAGIDADQFVVGFDQATHVIDLQSGVARAATPADYVTKSLGVASIGNAANAQRWLQFLNQVFGGDQELIDWLQRFCGYLLTGSTREHMFLFCFGHGANGKSVFIELLKYIMGDYSRAIASETLSESKRQAGGATPDLVALIGARLVLCSETEDNTALSESLVKSLVSGDSMAVRPLYSAPVQFTPNFKLVMAGNHKPVVRGNDNGIWRRVRMLPFGRTFAPNERDPHLLVKLKAEAPHILAWMVAGCIAWQQQGLADTPTTIRQATDDYQADQDLTRLWLEECTVPSMHGETASGDLYASYKVWCLDNGFKVSSSATLGRRLSERGYSVRQSHGKRIWGGLMLVSNQHADPSANASPSAYLRATQGH